MRIRLIGLFSPWTTQTVQEISGAPTRPIVHSGAGAATAVAEGGSKIGLVADRDRCWLHAPRFTRGRIAIKQAVWRPPGRPALSAEASGLIRTFTLVTSV